MKQARLITTGDKPNQKGSNKETTNKQPNKITKNPSGGGDDNSDERKKDDESNNNAIGFSVEEENNRLKEELRQLRVELVKTKNILKMEETKVLDLEDKLGKTSKLPRYKKLKFFKYIKGLFKQDRLEKLHHRGSVSAPQSRRATRSFSIFQ